LGGGRQQPGHGITIDFDRWRVCDAAAAVLLQRPSAPDALELELFRHGDLEERIMVLRSLGVRAVTDTTVELLGEAQRSNTVPHFEAAICDSNLLARARQSGRLGEPELNRMLLKLAFLDLPLCRVLEIEPHANVELSRMLQGLATEREAAGRAVWTDTNRLIGLRPAPGTLARLIGHLEHGDDRHRLAAAEGLAAALRGGAACHDELVRELLRERLDRESGAAIRAALERALQSSRTPED
jgi:hypothetical protein